ncbi:glycosyltransferase family 4 protein [Paraburkholderia megapolitana]|uniref:glycosyltransferase family 4 protein n=1 Tax=Paraburkholderia megapolitana TaxID=420953 RepID=UPI0038BB32EE
MNAPSGLPHVARATSRIRVLHVGPGWGQRGGIASVLDELAARRDRFAVDAVSLAFFETHGFHGIGSALRFFLQDVPGFIASLGKAEIVHFHVSERGSLYRKLVLFAFAQAYGKKTVFHLHSGRFEHFIAHAGYATRCAARWFARRAHAAIGVSSAIGAVLQNYRDEPRRLYVIGNTAGAAEEASQRMLPQRCDAAAIPYIAFAGRLSVAKGVGLLMEAMTLLKQQGCAVQLRLAGTGDVARWMKFAVDRNIDDRVVFEGWLDGDRKLAFYQNARLFCMPSQFESFGIAALEAMFCGVPVIGTKLGGFLDLVDEGVTGHLVEPGDAEALAARIRDLVEDPEHAANMGAAARDRAKLRYSGETIVQQYVGCYRAVNGGDQS